MKRKRKNPFIFSLIGCIVAVFVGTLIVDLTTAKTTGIFMIFLGCCGIIVSLVCALFYNEGIFSEGI